MTPVLSSSWIPRLFGLGTFFACFLLYYLLSDVQYPEAKPVLFDALPVFPSEAYMEIVALNDTSPDFQVTWPYRVFKSAPFNPPYINMYDSGGDLAHGYLIFTPKSRTPAGQKQDHAVIMGQDNELVYCHPEMDSSHNFRVQNINGAPHLTIWSGKSVSDYGYGNFFIMDQNYKKRMVKLNATVSTMRDDFEIPGLMDFHDQEVTEQGTVFVTAFNTVRYDLSVVGGPVDGFAVDSLVYEIDIKTGEVLFRWSSMEHLKVANSRLKFLATENNGHVDRPHDFFHINSIQPIGDDALLISSSHTWSVLLISRVTGDIIWELSGSGEPGVGSFGPLPTETQFRWQHHVRAHNWSKHGFKLSIFDNHNIENDDYVTSSRGLLFSVALPPNPSIPPALIHDMEPSDETFAVNQGNFEIGLSNGNQLTHSGPIPVIREFGPSGDSNDLRWEGRFGYDNLAQSYRVYKSEWHATPKGWVPELVVEADDWEQLTAYVSWNGATDVELWNVYTAQTGVKLEPLGRAKKQGFETVIELPPQLNSSTCIVVGAVQKGVEVAYSNMVCPKILT